MDGWMLAAGLCWCAGCMHCAGRQVEVCSLQLLRSIKAPTSCTACPTCSCVTPYLIVPGPWSEADLEYVADGVAAGLTNNAGGFGFGVVCGKEASVPDLLLCGCLALGQHPEGQRAPVMHPHCPPLPSLTGHNCLKAEMVVTDAGWPLRERFLACLRAKLASLPSRVAYYPGAWWGGTLSTGSSCGEWRIIAVKFGVTLIIDVGNLNALSEPASMICPTSVPGSDAKQAAFLRKFPDAERLGNGSTAADGAQLSSGSGRAEMRVTPWLLKSGLSPEQASTQDENWCGCLQVRWAELVSFRAGRLLLLLLCSWCSCRLGCWVVAFSQALPLITPAPPPAGGDPGLRRRSLGLHACGHGVCQHPLLGHAVLLRVCAPRHPGECQGGGSWLLRDWVAGLAPRRVQAACSQCTLGLLLPHPHPCTPLCYQQKRHAAAYDQMLAGLQYGAIAVNVPSLLSFVATKLGWGAFPGSTPQVRRETVRNGEHGEQKVRPLPGLVPTSCLCSDCPRLCRISAAATASCTTRCCLTTLRSLCS